MSEKLYFYEDPISKEKKKYEYCTLCQKGPFTQEQVGSEVFPFTDHVTYCRSCALMHRIKVNMKEPIQVILPEPRIISLSGLSGKALIELVDKTCGQVIAISPKSKSQIFKVARKILEEAGYRIEGEYVKEVAKIPKPVIEQPSQGVNGFDTLSAKQIIDKVFELSGQMITISVKSKKCIIRRAQEILSNIHKAA